MLPSSRKRITEAKMEAYREYLMERERKTATVEKYIRDVRKFKSFAGDAPITKEVVIAYKESLKGSYALTSINSMLVAVNRFLNSEDGANARTYLNSTFYNTLSQDVKDTIKTETSLKTPTVYNNFGAMETTSDKVYLLCQGGTSGSGTENVITPSGKDLTADTQLKEFLKCGTTAADKTTANYRWLRSPHSNTVGAGLAVCETGAVRSSGASVDYACGIRPAITLNLQG